MHSRILEWVKGCYWVTVTNHEQIEPITARCPGATHTTFPGRSPVMHLLLWLFSVNLALSQPSILRGHSCWREAFNVSLSPQTFIVDVFFFSSHLMYKRNVSLPYSTNPSLAIRLQMLPSKSEEQFICLAFVIVSWSHLRRLPPACFSMSHMLTDFFPSLDESLFIAHIPIWRGEDCSAARQSASQPLQCRSLYHFDGSIMNRLLGRMLSLWLKTQTGDSPNKTKKIKERKVVLWREKRWRQSEVWMFLTSINTIHHGLL